MDSKALSQAAYKLHSISGPMSQATIWRGEGLADMDAACEHWLSMRRQTFRVDAEVILGCCNSIPASGPNLSTRCSTLMPK